MKFLGELVQKADILTGEVVLCKCGAAFSFFSKQVSSIWVCEFCGTKCPVDLSEEEIPKKETVDYLLEGPTKPQEEKDIVVCKDDFSIIFVIDCSGTPRYSNQCESFDCFVFRLTYFEIRFVLTKSLFRKYGWIQVVMRTTSYQEPAR